MLFFFGPIENAELVPKFHVALYASHAVPSNVEQFHFNAVLSTLVSIL
jgi:hypothetical protein